MNRLREIDFLRGIAIILILLRHRFLFSFTQEMGWIGVDLFFVISGFLVSGLLFKEYLKFGNIQPCRFLIRRGFKIYPIYYLSYPLYLYIAFDNLSMIGFISDLTFTQNYIWGWGYAWPASWSLAIEEHFYFGLSFFLWLGLKYNKINLQKSDSNKFFIDKFENIIILIMFLCFVLRLFSNSMFPNEVARNFTMTHLRIDSLLAGVLISYLYYFRITYLTKIFQSHTYFLAIIAFLGLIWTPLINADNSYFVRTFGFSFLYFSFGFLLIYFLLTKDINEKLNKMFSTPIVNIISRIGYCSYSIYIIHSLVNNEVKAINLSYNLYNNYYFDFIITSIFNITIGMFMTYVIERYFLKIRDRCYPSRIA